VNVNVEPQREGSSRWTTFVRWFDSWAGEAPGDEADPRAGDRVDLWRVLPFLVLHAACALVIVVGWSWTAVGVAAVLYALRMFAITAFYHRFFSHRAFRTSRALQFLFAVVGASAIQRGPLWWAAHHRAHHRHSDEPEDAHSPVQHGFLWSHMGWFLNRTNFRTRRELVPDLMVFPELRFLDRFDVVVPLLLLGFLYGGGELLRAFAPELGTSGAQLVVWGFCISTVVLYHVTFSINSVAHRLGSRRYETPDESRNNWVLALLTFGEGWHNNHHRYQASVRQGFRWWEIDLSWYLLRLLASVGLVWELKAVPARILDGGKTR